MKKILIVEDDIATLELVELLLQDNGFAVIKVNGQISIKEIAFINPNLIIVDYLLPHVLGTTLCLEIKSSPLTKQIPVILYSASSNLKTLAKESCADNYIAKPFDIDDLIGLVQKMLV